MTLLDLVIFEAFFELPKQAMVDLERRRTRRTTVAETGRVKGGEDQEVFHQISFEQAQHLSALLGDSDSRGDQPRPIPPVALPRSIQYRGVEEFQVRHLLHTRIRLSRAWSSTKHLLAQLLVCFHGACIRDASILVHLCPQLSTPM